MVGYHSIAQATPSLGMAYYYYLQAVIEKSSGRLTTASDSLKKALTFDPESISILEELANVAMLTDNFKEAGKWAGQAIALDPDDLNMKMVLARVYINENRVARALGLLEEVLTEEPDELQALFLKGSIYAQAKEFPRAVEVLKKAAAQGGRQSFMAHYYLGKIYLDTGDLSKAEEELKETLRLNPHLFLVNGYLAEIYAKRGETDRAIDAYMALLARQPHNLKAQNRLLMLLLKTKQLDYIASELPQLQDMDVTNSAIGLKLVLVYLKLEKYDDALSILQGPARSYPDQDQILFYTAVVYEQKGDIDAAIETLKSIEKSGYSVSSLYMRKWRGRRIP